MPDTPRTCSECEYYHPDEMYSHTCKCPKMIYGYGKHDTDTDSVEIEDDEGWGMIPGPDFGCIHHKEVLNG